MDHREACLLLVEYVKGELSPERAAQVADHADGHPECREAVAFLAALQNDAVALGGLPGSGHPSADDLVAHATGAVDELEDAVIRSIERHLESCAECRSHVLVVARVYDELLAVDGEAEDLVAKRLPLGAVAGLALAAGLAIGFILPRHEPTRSPTGGPAPIVQVVGGVRGGGEAVVSVAHGIEILPVVAVWDPWTDRSSDIDYSIRISISDTDDDQQVWSLSTFAGSVWNAGGGYVSFVAPMSEVGYGPRRVMISDEQGRELFSGSITLTAP